MTPPARREGQVKKTPKVREVTMPLCIRNDDLDSLIEFYRERKKGGRVLGPVGTQEKTIAALKELRRARVKLSELNAKQGQTDE